MKNSLKHVASNMIHLTGLSRLLARQVSRRGLDDHKRKLTKSSGRENPAFGGPNPTIGCVAVLARPTRSRGALRLTEWADLAPSNGSYWTRHALATTALTVLALTFGSAYANGGSFNQGGVHIFTPTSTTPVDDSEPVKKHVIVKRTTIVKRIVYTRYRTRAERLRAMFGHRYTGFKKQYRGPKYPF